MHGLVGVAQFLLRPFGWLRPRGPRTPKIPVDDPVASDSGSGAGAAIDTGVSMPFPTRPAFRCEASTVLTLSMITTSCFICAARDIYHVRLPNRCPGLRIADSFMYSTSLSVLCDLDIIRPLRNFGGSLVRVPPVEWADLRRLQKKMSHFSRTRMSRSRLSAARPISSHWLSRSPNSNLERLISRVEFH